MAIVYTQNSIRYKWSQDDWLEWTRKIRSGNYNGLFWIYGILLYFTWEFYIQFWIYDWIKYLPVYFYTPTQPHHYPSTPAQEKLPPPPMTTTVHQHRRPLKTQPLFNLLICFSWLFAWGHPSWPRHGYTKLGKEEMMSKSAVVTFFIFNRLYYNILNH